MANDSNITKFPGSNQSAATKAGVDAQYIQDMLGHASSQTTNIYVHLFDEGRRNAVPHSKLWAMVE